MNTDIESEKQLERKLKEGIENLGGWSLKLLSTYINGLPDRLCLLPGGRLFFAEIKTTKKKTKTIQRLQHKRLKSIGFRVEVIDTSKQIDAILKGYG